MNTKNRAFRITIRAILTAIIMVQSMTPFLGYIPLGIVNLTIIHITVIVAAITLGTRDGLFVGLIWGLGTLVRAWTAPTSPLDSLVFTNPLVSVVPRILVGLVAGFIFNFFYRRSKNIPFSALASAICGTLTNTVLVLSAMGLLYSNDVARLNGVDTSVLFKTLALIAATNGIPEIIGAAVLTPLIVLAIFRATRLTPDHI